NRKPRCKLQSHPGKIPARARGIFCHYAGKRPPNSAAPAALVLEGPVKRALSLPPRYACRFSRPTKKKPGDDAPGFSITSDGASGGGRNTVRPRKRGKAHIRVLNTPAR